MSDLTIVIVNWNTRAHVAACLDSIARAAAGLAVETFVVDNASSDGSVAAIRARWPAVRVIANTENVGFAAANNQAMALAGGRYVLLLNSDTVLPDAALVTVVAWLDATPAAGMVGVTLVNPDGSFQAAHARFPTLLSECLSATTLGARLFGPSYPSARPAAHNGARRVDWIPGAFMCVRRDALVAVGGMDEGYWMYSEEVDWCYRFARAGWPVYYLPSVVVTHVGGASTRQRRLPLEAELYRSKLRFFQAHYGARRTASLRRALSAIFLVRAAVSRAATALTPSPQRRQAWREEWARCRAMRDAVRLPVSSSPLSS